jgi:uncharacterized protein YegP (UPF0339 family)
VKRQRTLVIYRRRDGQWSWYLRAGNYRKIASAGEGFSSHHAAEQAAINAHPGTPVRDRGVIGWAAARLVPTKEKQ